MNAFGERQQQQKPHRLTVEEVEGREVGGGVELKVAGRRRHLAALIGASPADHTQLVLHELRGGATRRAHRRRGVALPVKYDVYYTRIVFLSTSICVACHSDHVRLKIIIEPQNDCRSFTPERSTEPIYCAKLFEIKSKIFIAFIAKKLSLPRGHWVLKCYKLLYDQNFRHFIPNSSVRIVNAGISLNDLHRSF